MTKAGIEYDLRSSPYRATCDYQSGNSIIYLFSSQRGLDSFNDAIIANRNEIHESLSNRFKMKFYLSPEFCDVQLYRKTERRGFVIIFNGELVTWSASLRYGQKLELMNSSGK